MELELPHGFRLRSGISGYAGLGIARNSHKRRLENSFFHLAVAGAYVDSMYTGHSGTYARA